MFVTNIDITKKINPTVLMHTLTILDPEKEYFYVTEEAKNIVGDIMPDYIALYIRDSVDAEISKNLIKTFFPTFYKIENIFMEGCE